MGHLPFFRFLQPLFSKTDVNKWFFNFCEISWSELLEQHQRHGWCNEKQWDERKNFWYSLTLQTQNLFFRVETKTMEIGLLRILQDLPAAVMLACQRNSTCLSSVVSHSVSGGPGSATGLCIMCSEQPADTIIFPCQHKCACLMCLQAVYGADHASCPMCLGPLTSIERIG